MISQCCAQQKLLYASDDSGDESDGDDNGVFFNIVQNGGGDQIHFEKVFLSSPRAKRVGPKGLRAESARAVTGRRCPHSGEGEDFLTRQLGFFYENS